MRRGWGRWRRESEGADDRRFEEDLASLWDSDLERADAIESFGVMLWVALEDHPAKRQALPCRDRATSLYRQALDGDDPELAMALVSRVDAEIQLAGHPPRTLDAVVEETGARLPGVAERRTMCVAAYRAGTMTGERDA